MAQSGRVRLLPGIELPLLEDQQAESAVGAVAPGKSPRAFTVASWGQSHPGSLHENLLVDFEVLCGNSIPAQAKLLDAPATGCAHPVA